MRLQRSALIFASALTLTVGLTRVAMAVPTVDETAAAREHYKHGTKLYDLGKYDEAIVEFQQAYEIKDDPVLLYNIAQSYRLSNNYRQAVTFYRTYLRKSPNAKNKDEVDGKIADMEALSAQQSRVANLQPGEAIPPRGDRPATGISARPTAEPTVVARTETRAYTPPPPPPVDNENRTPTETTPDVKPTDTTAADTHPTTATTPPVKETHTAEFSSPVAENASPGRGKLIAGVVIAVVGVAALAVGIVEGVSAMGKSSDQEKLATQGKAFDPSLESDGKSAATIGLAMDAVGGVLIVAGVIVAGLGAAQKPEQAPRASFVPTLGRHSAGAALSISF